MNRRPTRNTRYYRKSRNWLSFDDGNHYKRGWHDLDDIWKPNYDYDDYDEEGENANSSAPKYDTQQFNSYVHNNYNNPYRLCQSYSNNRGKKREEYGNSSRNYSYNKLSNLKRIYPNSQNSKTGKELSSSTSIQYIDNPNGEPQKDVKLQYAETNKAEKLQLIHSDISAEHEKTDSNLEDNLKLFNINPKLSYLENYTVRTTEVLKEPSELKEVGKTTSRSLISSSVNDRMSGYSKEVKTNSLINHSNEESVDINEYSKTYNKQNANNSKISHNNMKTADPVVEVVPGLDTFVQNVLNLRVSDTLDKRHYKDQKEKQAVEDLNKKRILSKLSKNDSDTTDKSDITKQSKHCKIANEQTFNANKTYNSVETNLAQLFNENVDTLSVKCESKNNFRKRKNDVDISISNLKLPKIIKDSGDKFKPTTDDSIQQSGVKNVYLESAGNIEKHDLLLSQIGKSPEREFTSIKTAKIIKRRKTVTVTTASNSELTKVEYKGSSQVVAKLRRTRSQSVDWKEVPTTRITRSKSKELNMTYECLPKNYKERLLPENVRLKRTATGASYSLDTTDNGTSSEDRTCTKVKRKRSKHTSGKHHQPKPIPQNPIDLNLKDPRLRSNHHRNQQLKTENPKIKLTLTREKNNPMYKIDTKTDISQQGLNFLFGEKPVKTSKKAPPSLTNSQSTVPWNLKECDVPNLQLSIFFKVNDAIETSESIKTETVSNLDIKMQECQKPDQKTQEPVFGIAKCVDPPKILNDQCIVKQNKDLNMPQKQKNCNTGTAGSQNSPTVIPNVSHENISVIPNTTQFQHNILNATLTTASTLNNIPQPQINMVVAGNACTNNGSTTNARNMSTNKPQSTPNKNMAKAGHTPLGEFSNFAHVTTSVTYEDFLKEFYYSIFFYCDTVDMISSRFKFHTDSGFHVDAVTTEFRDYYGCLKFKMRQFAQRLYAYFQNRCIAFFNWKTLLWHYYSYNQACNLSFLLFPQLRKFFYSTTLEIKRIGPLNSFLEVFCNSIGELYSYNNAGASTTASNVNSSNLHRQNQLVQVHQPPEQLQSNKSNINSNVWEEPKRQQSTATRNGATNRSVKLTSDQRAQFQFQCDVYNNLIKNFYIILGNSKQTFTTRPTMPNTRGCVASSVPNVNLTNQQITIPQVSTMFTPKTTPSISNLTASRARATNLNQNIHFHLQTDGFSSSPNNSNSRETFKTNTNLPSEQVNVTHSTVQSTRGNIASTFSTVHQEINNPQHDTRYSATAMLNPNHNLQARVCDYTEVNQDLSKQINITDSMNSFKIRLPLSQPYSQTVTNTTIVSTVANCNTTSLTSSVAHESTSMEEKVNIKVNKKENVQIEEEIIDVDEWFETKIQASDFIDLDDYYYDDTMKTEQCDELSQNDNATSVSAMEMIPRFGSVDSGFSSPPSQIKHPDVLRTQRMCICTKIAELMCLCGKAIYCSTNCQRANWDVHKEQCIRTREASIASS